MRIIYYVKCIVKCRMISHEYSIDNIFHDYEKEGLKCGFNKNNVYFAFSFCKSTDRGHR